MIALSPSFNAFATGSEAGLDAAASISNSKSPSAIVYEPFTTLTVLDALMLIDDVGIGVYVLINSNPEALSPLTFSYETSE